ncbi:putative ribonuclease H-like domain-containing protein [Tanacetum coccineum]
MEVGTTTNNLTARLPILNPGDYDLWLMRIEQYFLMTDYSLWEVIKNGNKVLRRTVGTVEQEYEPTTAEEKQDRRNEMKARATLLMALPNKDQLKFHSYQDAKLLMEAIEKRYGGNKESKKLEIQGEVINQEDMNLKLLRSLPSEWKTHALIWRNKVEIKTISLDDLYNNLKIYEQEITGSSSTSQNSQNMAFVFNSTNNTISTNKADDTAHGVSTTHSTTNTQGNGVNSVCLDNLCDAMICAFLASQPNYPQLSQEDLEQLHPDDLDEIDLQWEMVMLTIRARRFIKRTRKKLDINSQRLGFDKSKVECFNCHKHRHFARECKFPRNQEYKRRENNTRTITVETPTQNALIAQDGIGGYDWSYQVKEELPTNHALMEFTSSGSSSNLDSEVDSYSKTCVKAYASLKEQYDNLSSDYKKYQLNLVSYKAGLGYVAATTASPAVESFVNLTDKYGLDKGYHSVSPPLTGNFVPRKPDLRFVDEIVEIESNAVRMNNTSAPIIEDWNSNDECEIDYTVRPNTEKIESVKTVRETDAPKQNKQNPRGNQRNWNNLMSQRLGSDFKMTNKVFMFVVVLSIYIMYVIKRLKGQRGTTRKG